MQLLVFFVAAALATVPEHAVFLCGEGADCAGLFANEWLAAAQEEAVRTYHTLNGGWLEPVCCGSPSHGPEVRVKPFAINLGAVLCIPHNSFPIEECASKKCDFASHPELFQDDCSQLDGPCPSECRLSTDPNFNYLDISPCSKSSVVQGSLNQPNEEGLNCETAYGLCLYTAENATIGQPCFCPLPQPACTCTGTWDGNGKVYGATCTIDTESCRTIESWLDIAKWLLVDALEYAEQCEWHAASSAACAAEFLYRTINEWILTTYAAQADELEFINPAARVQQHYVHINSPLRTVTFNGTLFTAQLRVVQSVRTCGTCGDAAHEPVTSLLVYSRTSGDPDALETTQLLWALTGVLSDFGSVLPFAPNNECGLQHIQSNLPLFLPQRRVPRLGPQDWATVRCDGAPRETTDLRIESICPLVLLFAALVPGEPTDELHSLAHLQLRDGPTAPLAPLAAAQLVEGALVLRVATGTGGECHDYCLLMASNVYDNCTLNEQPLAAISDEHQDQVPLTLPPGTSRCVGGTADGQECSAKNECGVGMACRRKPFEPDTVAFCYDGLTWHANKPCAFADEDASCPYGSCVGAINGFEGGLFPMLHFHQEAECASDSSASACQHEAVANWHQYPNLALFKQ